MNTLVVWEWWYENSWWTG